MKLIVLIWAIASAAAFPLIVSFEPLLRQAHSLGVAPQTPADPASADVAPVAVTTQEQAAAQLARTLKDLEKRMVVAHDDLAVKIDTLIADARSQSTETTALTHDAMLDAAVRFEGLGTGLLAHLQNQLTRMDMYITVCGEASRQFREVAERNRKLAREEAFEDHRHSYLELAGLWDTLSVIAEEKSLAMPLTRSDIQQHIAYITATHGFWKRFVEQTNALGDYRPTPGTGRYRALAHYATAWEQSLASLRTFRAQLTAETLPLAEPQLLANAHDDNGQEGPAP